MLLALATCTLVALALVWELARGRLSARMSRRPGSADAAALGGYDPGRERRAETRARALLRSCVNEEDWAMYRDLGFLRVWGRNATVAGEPGSGAPYAYLIYPHKPLVAYVPQTGVLLSEYCVEFPDLERPYGSPRLPDADDVLAKWMALTADEHRVIDSANMHLPGRQVDPSRVRRDLVRLKRWEQSRLHEGRGADSVSAP